MILLSGASINGILYAIPANKEKAHNWGFIVRMDLVKKYKLDDMFKKVKKLEDLEPYLQDNQTKRARRISAWSICW